MNLRMLVFYHKERTDRISYIERVYERDSVLTSE